MPSLLDGHNVQQRSVILSSFHALPPPPRRNSLFVPESMEKGDPKLSPEGGEEKDFSSKQPIDREERGDSLVNREDSLVDEDERNSLLTDKDEASSPPKKPTSPAEKRPAQEATVNEESQHIRETTANDEKRQKIQESQNTVLQGICSHLRQHGQELLHQLQQEQLLPPTATVDTVTPEMLA